MDVGTPRGDEDYLVGHHAHRTTHPTHLRTRASELELDADEGASAPVHDVGVAGPSTQVSYESAALTSLSASAPLPMDQAAFDEEPLYVNAKQYYRILKRRLARQRLEELHRLSRQRKVRFFNIRVSLFRRLFYDL